MTKIILISITLLFSSCSYYYQNICNNADPRVKFIQKIVDNPENLDSLVTNSVYFDKKFSKSTVAIFSKNNLNQILKYKGFKLNYLSSLEIISIRNYNEKPLKRNEEINEYHLGVTFDNTKEGLLVIYEERNGKWILIAIDIESKERLLDYLNEGGIYRNTLY